MAAIDVDARQLVMEAWSMERRQSPTLAAVQAVQAVARLETGYSTTWKTPGVHNWGAITCNRVATAEGDCGPNCFLSRDHDAQGRVVKRCFRRYAKPLDGVRALLREMLVRRPAVDAVVNAGDVLAIAQAMHDTRYFEAPVPKYAHAMLEHAGWIARTLGEPLMLRGAAAAPPPAPSAPGIAQHATVAAGVALGVLAWLWLDEKPKKGEIERHARDHRSG
jgi:hypothetical protein